MLVKCSIAGLGPALVVLALVHIGADNQSGSPPAPARKHVLAWADVRNGYQHDSISHAIATVERLGWESGLYDTFIRTDSQLITRQPVAFPANIGIASSVTPLARNLNYFDAIFFFGVREIDLTAAQRSDLLAFVKDDGKGFVAAHSAITSFFSWPEFGDMIGGRFDEHPWDIVEARVVVDDRTFPATRHLPPSFVIQDEHYQIKDFSRGKMRILARLDPASLDLQKPLVHRTDGDFPIAWAKEYGKGRVFYSTLGHDAETWDNPMVRTMYFEAIKWALGLVPGATAPIPKP
jgi:type 1 glutamine amidotransferase